MRVRGLRALRAFQVLVELVTADDMMAEFWSAVIELLKTCGLPGHRFVAETLQALARIGARMASQNDDPRLAQSVCHPRVLVPLAEHLATDEEDRGESLAAQRTSSALSTVPDLVFSLLQYLQAEEQGTVLSNVLMQVLEAGAQLQGGTAVAPSPATHAILASLKAGEGVF